MSHAAIGAASSALLARSPSLRSKSTRASRAKSSSKTAIVAPTRAAIAEPETTRPPSARASGRKRVVVLGSGWGAISFVKSLSASAPYDVVLVSPRNYFLYTPLLPGAATGAVEERSIVEPIRRPIAEKGYKYFEAACVGVDAETKTITCRAADATFDATVPFSDLATRTEANAMACPWHTFDVEYDYLVTAVGAVPNTFGVKGVEENCLFFKEIADASRFRREVSERFERATLPDVPEERIREILTFVVIGAGPTGVELAAELYDMVRDRRICSSLRGFSFFHFPLSLFSLPFPSSRPGPTPTAPSDRRENRPRRCTKTSRRCTRRGSSRSCRSRSSTFKRRF